ncbi:MAG: alpha-1,2-fucosyltransferase [Candidatus Babeliales bacterium]|nr:alpha-1,2-fucosyltransferase [Candidatus Babeliales bacterium]
MKIKCNFFALGFLFFIFNFLDNYCEPITPNIHITCDSHMLGNRLFIFCYSKILAEQLHATVISEPIKGFPNTYNLLHSNSETTINKHGYFQRYEYYQPYKKQIKEWLKLDSQIIPHADKDDIIIHIRSLENMYYVPFDYYQKALADTSYNKVYICIDDPNSSFLDNFKVYKPIIIKHANPFDPDATLQDFKLIMSFNKIIASKSTFSWWAAFLSDASEIYIPKTNHGMMSPEVPEVDLFVTDEPRYKYIECNW